MGSSLEEVIMDIAGENKKGGEEVLPSFPA